MEGDACTVGCGENVCAGGCVKDAEDREEGGERAGGGAVTEGEVLLVLFLGGIYKDVLDTALLASDGG